jgi:hypothetical protein
MVYSPILKHKSKNTAQNIVLSLNHSVGGWLDRFRQHSGIVHKKISGEPSRVSQVEVAAAWKHTVFLHLMSRCTPKGCTCGIFYNMHPSTPANSKEEVTKA